MFEHQGVVPLAARWAVTIIPENVDYDITMLAGKGGLLVLFSADPSRSVIRQCFRRFTEVEGGLDPLSRSFVSSPAADRHKASLVFCCERPVVGAVGTVWTN